MAFSGICEYLSQMCLYLATVRFVFTFLGEIQSPWPVAGIFLAAGITAGVFSRFKGFKAYLPMLLVVPAFILSPTIISAVTLVPMVMLLGFRIYKNSWKGDSVVIRGSITAGLIAYAFILMISAVSAHYPVMVAESIPFFVLFLMLCILGLRVLRNEESGRTSFVFYALNTAIVVLVALSGFIFSNSWLLNAVKTGLKAAYDYVIGPLLMGFAYIVIIIPLALGWLLEKLKTKEGEVMELEMDFALTDEEKEEMLGDLEQKVPPEWVGKFFAALGIVIFLVICFFVIRKLVTDNGRAERSGGKLTRVTIDEEEAPRRRRRSLRNTAADAVRACYRKYLNICDGMSIPVDGTYASDEIAYRSEGVTGTEPTQKLRSLWLPARYSDEDSSEEDVKLAKQCIKEIKKQIK